MKKDRLFLLWAICGAFFMMFFVGCKNPTIEVPKVDTSAVTTPTTETPTTETLSTEVKPYYVKNSAWENVDVSTIITARAASDPSLDEALAIVAAYNASNNDNQLFLYTTDVSIEEAPTVDVYIVNEGDYAPLAEYIGLDRADFVARRADFDSDARVYGGILFVDKVPPVPVVVPDTRTRHEKYSLYMVNKYDKVVVVNGFRYEQHIDEIWDTLTDDVKAGYNNDIDVFMSSRVSGFETEIRGVGLVPEDAPWRVEHGYIYVEPTE